MSQAGSRVLMRYLLQSLRLCTNFSRDRGRLYKSNKHASWLESSLILTQHKHSFSNHAGVEIAFEHISRCSRLAVAQYTPEVQ